MTATDPAPAVTSAAPLSPADAAAHDQASYIRAVDPGYALLRAFNDWLDATTTPSAVTTATLTLTVPGHGSVHAKLTPGQADRAAHLFAVDADALTARNAAAAVTPGGEAP